ncbi:MAG TPA: hypothetical protein VE961_27895 [Pyrinomonadaceae bacterium]|nr:hypothetical protein [Pyrinomonadaceae bacterium]
MTATIYQPTDAELQATLETRHCVMKAFGRNLVEAYMTLHYAWRKYAEEFSLSPNLINVYRYAIEYASIPRTHYAVGTALVDDELYVTNALDTYPPVLHYINRKGQIYFLHNAGLKDGLPLFTFSMDLSGQLASEIPHGHESYEAPNGMVFVRPIVKSLITTDEQSVLERLLKANFREEAYKAEVKKRSIVVHMASEYDVDRLLEHSLKPENIQYQTGFKFDLVTKKTGARKFIVRLLRAHDNRWVVWGEISDLHKEAVPAIANLARDIKRGILSDLNQALFEQQYPKSV